MSDESNVEDMLGSVGNSDFKPKSEEDEVDDKVEKDFIKLEEGEKKVKESASYKEELAMVNKASEDFKKVLEKEHPE